MAPVVDGQISYGALSHSTLNQLLKNIVARCPVIDGGASSVAAEFDAASAADDGAVSRIVDGAGKLSVGLLQQCDPAFASAVHTGRQWEVLSYKIEEEEPDGCAVIQSTFNIKNALATTK